MEISHHQHHLSCVMLTSKFSVRKPNKTVRFTRTGISPPSSPTGHDKVRLCDRPGGKTTFHHLGGGSSSSSSSSSSSRIGASISGSIGGGSSSKKGGLMVGGPMKPLPSSSSRSPSSLGTEDLLFLDDGSDICEERHGGSRSSGSGSSSGSTTDATSSWYGFQELYKTQMVSRAVAMESQRRGLDQLLDDTLGPDDTSPESAACQQCGVAVGGGGSYSSAYASFRSAGAAAASASAGRTECRHHRQAQQRLITWNMMDHVMPPFMTSTVLARGAAPSTTATDATATGTATATATDTTTATATVMATATATNDTALRFPTNHPPPLFSTTASISSPLLHHPQHRHHDASQPPLPLASLTPQQQQQQRVAVPTGGAASAGASVTVGGESRRGLECQVNTEHGRIRENRKRRTVQAVLEAQQRCRDERRIKREMLMRTRAVPSSDSSFSSFSSLSSAGACASRPTNKRSASNPHDLGNGSGDGDGDDGSGSTTTKRSKTCFRGIGGGISDESDWIDIGNLSEEEYQRHIAHVSSRGSQSAKQFAFMMGHSDTLAAITSYNQEIVSGTIGGGGGGGGMAFGMSHQGRGGRGIPLGLF